MRVMVIVHGNEESEAGGLPDTGMLSEMQVFNEALAEAGVLLAAEGLHPTSKSVRVRFSGPERAVVHGPFTDAKELVAGFWLWEVRSMAEAVDWLKRAPFDGGAEVEIRPVFELEDFGPALTPELRAREEHLRALLDAKR